MALVAHTLRLLGTAAALAVLACDAGPALAARPLLDNHQWDAYFALYARDSSVPWKPASVRLDTYSGASVEFAAYNVDPADVIVAGASAAARPLDTAHRQALVRWRFSPPAGYRFETSDVAVPLGSQEGFYVVEARRGEAVQQVWVNRTHLGLLTQESPEGLLVWCVDLRSGRPIGGANVSFLVGLRLVVKRTDGRGLIAWNERRRPTFVLAEHGAGRAFVSVLPQAPLPAAIVGLRLESAVGRAGEPVRFVGFARRRTRDAYRRASGDARVTLAGRGKTLAMTVAHLNPSGAFTGELAVPEGVEAGDYAVLASAAGGVGGTSVHLDAAGDVALAIRSTCPCEPGADVPFFVVARRLDAAAPGVPLRVQIVRAPHVVPPGAVEDAVRWGTTAVLDRSLRTDAEGRARVTIPAPSDGLDSTYGIRATARGATATTRIVVSNASLALALEPAAPRADVGEPIAFAVRGFDPADGSPVAGLDVRVRLSHGASAQEQTVRLNERGEARVVFRQTSLGSNLAIAETAAGTRRALDAAAVLVEPRALAGRTISAESTVALSLSRARYRPGEQVAVRATAPGAAGYALLTLAGARTYGAQVAPVTAGTAAGMLPLGEAQGDVRVAAALVREGAIALGTQAVTVEGPGHPSVTEIALDKTTYAAGDLLHATLRSGDAGSGATLALRIADGRESGPALFDDAPDVLRTGATLAQTPASAEPGWHAYVVPARSKASDIFAAERPRKVATEVPSLGAAAPRTAFWRVARAEGDSLTVPVPKERGHYVLSLLRISDDGDVGAASVGFNVE